MREAAGSGYDIANSILDLTYGISLADLTPDALTLARDIWLDWLGVAIAGAREPLVDILIDEAISQGTGGSVPIPGRTERLRISDAALVAGAASHALDYDDGSAFMAGHTSVVILPVLFTLAEQLRSTGKDVIEALLTAHETAARVARLVNVKDHYVRGFHPTATIAVFGAAAGAARLMQLDQNAACVAMSIAGAQASGLRAVFGTMGKPLNAGRAALNGLLGARLAARGFTAPQDIFTARHGFCDSFEMKLSPDEGLGPSPEPFHVFGVLFKHFAACRAAHPAIEVSQLFRSRHPVAAADVRRVIVHVPEFVDQMANIQEPRTGLELKFSVRAIVALVLLGHDCSDPLTFTDAMAADPAVTAMRDKVSVNLRSDFDPHVKHWVCEIEVELQDGSRLEARYAAEEDRISILVQEQRLINKFRRLTSTVLGLQATSRLESLIMCLEKISDFRQISDLVVPNDYVRESAEPELRAMPQ